MKVINEQQMIKSKILGLQNVKEDVLYRPFFYIKSLPVDKGTLILNLLTFELIFLNKDELCLFKKNVKPDTDIAKELIKKWFLVPMENDDLKTSKQTENLVLITNKIYSSPKYCGFAILPTTDCNARCFYCFEHGIKKKWMSEKVANDVGDFIIKNNAGTLVTLHWFGGEPLYNDKVIDIICKKLHDNNVIYTSNITTNGYLFDEEMIERAISLWNLNKVQITLDGTEKKYNQIKNFIYKDVNAYKKVLQNVDLLLKKGINVQIRMNMDQNNVDDLYDLTDELIERYKSYKNVKIYPRLIIDESCARIKSNNSEVREQMVKKQEKLEEYILAKGKNKIGTKFFENHQGHCLADIDGNVLITPDGNLSKCQYFVDSNFIGNIYKDEINFKMLNWYKDVRTVSDECDNCIFRSLCLYPKCCFRLQEGCIDYQKELISRRLDNKMLNCYKEFERINGE